MLTVLDRYIIKKFLGTFVLSIALIISIAIIFDISEKLEDFISRKAPIKAIIFDYYLNFIPFFANLFSPLFTFISVIFFTSRMAYNTEIIAILSGGVSFRRLLRPYMISSFIIALTSLLFNFYVIPAANKKRLTFEENYIRNRLQYTRSNVHIQDSKDTYVFFESFNNFDLTGYRFSLEKYKQGAMYYKINAESIVWDSTTNGWQLRNYIERKIDGMQEVMVAGVKRDTILNVTPKEFTSRINSIEAKTITELNRFIESEKSKGSDEIAFFEVEKYKRSAFPFATFILTIIGVAISCKKVRGGIGMQLGLGLGLGFGYLMFQQAFTTFAYYGGFSPLAAVWLPNILFLILSLVLLKTSPK